MGPRRVVVSLSCALLLGPTLGACSQHPASPGGAPNPAPAVGATGPLSLEAVNAAQLSPAQPPQTAGASAAAAKTPNPVLIKAEVLLDRAKFSPGVIDGLNGDNFQNALKAYEAAHNMPADGRLHPDVWAALTADKAPVLKTYTITQADVAGPFAPDVGEDFVKMSKLPTLAFHGPVQELSERFHMDENLLKTLNPGADFSKPGTTIVVANPGPPVLAGEVKRIEVDKDKEQVRAYDAQGRLLALYPATVGSTERPSPTGTFHVRGVSHDPDYVYDPSKLTWGPKWAGKLRIPPGPNNPVGVVWIALSAPDYGIHGSPDPRLIGKTASHGCVRLTNWDALELAGAVKPGVQVVFLTSGSDDEAASSADEDQSNSASGNDEGSDQESGPDQPSAQNSTGPSGPG